MPARPPAEIRSSIESNRQELALSVERLRGEVARATDWRSHLERARQELIVGAQRHQSEIAAGVGAVGLLLGVRILRRRRRRG